MELKVGCVVFKVIVVGDVIGNVLVEQHRGLVGPTSCHVANGVATAAQDQRRDAKAFGVLDALGVALEAEVETSQPIPREGIGPALQHDGPGAVHLHNLGHDGLEDLLVGGVGHPGREGGVDGIAGAVLGAGVLDVAGPREEVAVLVQAEGHDTVGAVEGLLDAVAVMDVDVDVQDAGVHLEELEDGQDDVIDVAEAGRLGLLGVMEAPGPVDGDVGVVVVEADGPVDGGAGVQLGELEQSVEDGTVGVLPGVELLHLAGVLPEVVGVDLGEEVDVVVGVEGRHLLRRGRVGAVAVHLPVEAVRQDEVVGQLEPVRFHGVGGSVVEVADVRGVKVRHPPLGRHDELLCVVVYMYVCGKVDDLRASVGWMDNKGSRIVISRRQHKMC